MKKILLSMLFPITLGATQTLKAAEIEPFSNGYVLLKVKPDEIDSLLSRMSIGKLQELGGTSRFSPNFSDLRGFKQDGEFALNVKRLLIDASSFVGECDDSTIVLSHDKTMLLLLFRGK